MEAMFITKMVTNTPMLLPHAPPYDIYMAWLDHPLH